MEHPPKAQRRRHVPMLRGAALAAVGLASLACSTGANEPTSGRAQGIANGTADDSHQNVFLLARETQDSGALCTATLIAPNLLLTARHCVSPGSGDDHVLCGDSVLGDPYPASAFFATNDARLGGGDVSQVFRAIAVRVPGLGVDTCGYDVALVILKRSVPADVSTPAVPRIDREVKPGESYTAVGYGVNEAGNPTHGRMQLEGLSIECEPGSCGDGVESTEFRGETGICSGDSGGPALDADGKVVGVVSRGGPDCSTPVYSTVTAWHDFIIETAQEAADLGGYEAPFWVTTGLSDPPVLVGQDGAGGAGGASSEAAGANEGESCDQATACRGDLVCYQSASGRPGVCSTLCQATAECSAGLECRSVGSVAVCAVPNGGGDESSGCSLATGALAGRRGQAWLAMLGAGALALARRRRAR